MSNEELLAVLRAIDEELGGELSAEAVVEAASDPDHPLHDDPNFYWGDDAQAAHQHRLTYAGSLIRRVEYRTVTRAEERPATRHLPVYVHKPSNPPHVPGHVRLESIKEDSDDAKILTAREIKRVIGVLDRAVGVIERVGERCLSARLAQILEELEGMMEGLTGDQEDAA